MFWGWIIGIAFVAVVGISIAQYRAQASTYRSLSSRQPERMQAGPRPLGTEALDLEAVQRTQRRNESLERAHTSLTRGRGISSLESAGTDVQPLADDETYARRFHAAFQRNKDKT